MTKILSLLMLILVVSSLKAQSTEECKRFHTGTFKDLSTGCTITRTETRQREVSDKNDEFFEGTIKWLSDCEYEILLEKTNSPTAKEMIGLKIRGVIKTINGNVATIVYVAEDGFKGSMKIEKVEIQ